MKTNSKFVIGDIQGCYKEFKNLIKLIDPNKENKFLCVGDLVNRGPESEKVVDYVIKNNVKSVFGNHDLHLMAILIGCLLYTSPSPRDRQKSRMPSSA